MKNFKLMIVLLIIAVGTVFSVLAITLDRPECNGCILHFESVEETALNRFCYPSIQSDYSSYYDENSYQQSFSPIIVFAGLGDTTVCMQIENKSPHTIVSF
ncbi:MAG: hypothetical protein ACU837_07165 [Gammaproteobacteria bacterium]